MTLKRLALVRGHSKQSQGGPYHDGGASEYLYNQALVTRLFDRLQDKLDVIAIGYPDSSSYRAAASQVIERVEEFKADLVVEFHFNSVPENHPRWAQGGCLHWGALSSGKHAYRPSIFSTLGRGWGERLACAVDALGYESWGSRPIDRSWNGPGKRKHPDGTPLPDGPPLYILTNTSMPAVIWEGHNGRNPAMHLDFLNRMPQLADELVSVFLA